MRASAPAARLSTSAERDPRRRRSRRRRPPSAPAAGACACAAQPRRQARRGARTAGRRTRAFVHPDRVAAPAREPSNRRPPLESTPKAMDAGAAGAAHASSTAARSSGTARRPGAMRWSSDGLAAGALPADPTRSGRLGPAPLRFAERSGGAGGLRWPTWVAESGLPACAAGWRGRALPRLRHRARDGRGRPAQAARPRRPLRGARRARRGASRAATTTSSRPGRSTCGCDGHDAFFRRRSPRCTPPAGGGVAFNVLQPVPRHSTSEVATTALRRRATSALTPRGAAWRWATARRVPGCELVFSERRCRATTTVLPAAAARDAAAAALALRWAWRCAALLARAARCIS